MLKVRSPLRPPIHEHTHRPTHISPYIYICVCVCVCVCVCSIPSLMHISLNNIDMLGLHIFVYVFPVAELILWYPTGIGWWNSHNYCYPTTFFSILGHHQGCVYCKRNVTFACTLQLCKCLLFILVCCSVLFVSISSVSS